MTVDVHEAERQLLTRIRTEGVQTAYETALSICRDPKATSPARATASATLFRVAGYFNRTDPDGGSKEPHEMSGEELDREIRRLQRRANEKNPGVFD